MPTLDFKGKSFIYTHHLGVPYRELIVEPEKSCPPMGKQPDLDDNLIIHGDNLEVLKALLPRYAGKVDCIYIDPPYNTGSEGWCYNDAVNAPLMRDWLKKAANPVERDDLQRHDKWLCMMWPRLQLLKELLAEHGAIFVSIDDNELHRLRAIMDEVFDQENFVSCIAIRANPRGRQSDTHVATVNESILVYAKYEDDLSLGGVPLTDEDVEEFDQTDPDGKCWRELGLRQRGSESLREDREDMFFPIYVNPNDGTVSLEQDDSYNVEVIPKKSDGREGRWMWGYGKVETEIKRVYARKISRRGEFDIFIKDYLDRPDGQRTKKPRSMWLGNEVNTEIGGKLLKQILGKKAFDYPKPVGLVTNILQLATNKNSLILDSFAGSGTTAHAVLALNAKDGGNRKFILCETEDYADTLTAERVRRVINGYEYTGTQETELLPPEKVTWTTFAKDKKRNGILDRIEGIKMFEGVNYEKIETKIDDGVLTVVGKRTIQEKMPGLGGSFTYVELGEAMDLERLLAETPGTLPGFHSLARYLFFTATGHTLPTAVAADEPTTTAKDKKKAKALPVTETVTADAPVFIGETAVWRIYLHYRPDEAWLRSPAAAFTRSHAEAIAAECKGTGKQSLVFAAAKFINHKSLRELKVDFAQLPYALHRVQSE